MKRLLLLSLLSAFATISFAQTKPVFFPEDIESNTLELNCLCKPGVENKSRSRGLEIIYHVVSGSEVFNEDDVPLQMPRSKIRSIQNINFKLKVPILNQEGFKLLAGVTYRPEEYHFNVVGPDYRNVFQHLDGRQLKSSGFDLLGTKSLNEKFYTVLRFRALYNGDYKGTINFDNQYAIYNLSALFGIKKTDDLEYGFGLNISKSFRRTLALPFILFNKNFNERWGIEAVFPALVLARYNASEQTILLSGFRYNSRSYSINVPDGNAAQIYEMNHSEMRFIFTVEQRLFSWLWMDVQAGYQLNFSSDFEAQGNSEANFMVEPKGSLYGQFGIFISPPDNFGK